MINLIGKIKLFSEKQFYDKFFKFSIQFKPQIPTNRGVYLLVCVLKRRQISIICPWSVRNITRIA